MAAAELTIPGGREQGTPISKASRSALEYWSQRIEGALKEGTSHNPRRDKELVSQMKAALAVQGQGSRANSQSRAPSAGQSEGKVQGQALARSDPARLKELSGSFHEPNEVMARLAKASREAILVSPQTSCGELPVGCAIAMSVVFIDVDNETYGIPYKDSDERGLDKTALERIASAAGLSWDPELTRRLDDGSDPHYVPYRAVGYVRRFDGTQRTLRGEVEMDLREGSQTAIETEERAAKSNKDNTELALMRKFILRHAESKAMNRAIRRLGVRTKYKRAELEQKPFVVANVMFTGHTDDPDIKKLFAQKTFEAFHGAQQIMYSPPPPHATARVHLHAPPPMAASEHDDDDRGDFDDDERRSDPDDGDDYGSADYGEYEPALPSGEQRMPEDYAQQPGQQELKT
jgi:hypothetical protein